MVKIIFDQNKFLMDEINKMKNSYLVKLSENIAQDIEFEEIPNDQTCSGHECHFKRTGQKCTACNYRTIQHQSEIPIYSEKIIFINN